MPLRDSLKIISLVAMLLCNSAYGSNRKQCSSRELTEKSCLLKAWDYTIKLTKEKIILNNKVWRSLEKIPFTGDRTTWDSVLVTSLGSRRFLSIKVWDKPVGEADIQSLYWVLYELENGKVLLKVQQELQKRRWSGEGRSKLRDRRWRTALKKGRNGQVLWIVGNQKGEF